jgi:fructokinase
MPTENTPAEKSMPTRSIIVIGEALMDQFPDGSSVIGGAPLNVAWHLCGLGLQPVFLSAVGDDPYGLQIREAIREWGMTTRGLQINAEKSTGVVHVHLENGQPSYEIVTDQAYDHIAFPAELAAELQQSSAATEAHGQPLLYHGSLCLRHETSRETIFRMRETLDAEVFVDINLREGHYHKEDFGRILRGLDHLKCNVDELETITGQSIDSRDQIQAMARQVVTMHQLKACWITDGSNGAYHVDQQGSITHAPQQTLAEGEFADAVGAGDAFAAMILRGIERDDPPQKILAEAGTFAAQVCKMSGATTKDTSLYESVTGRSD